MFTDSLFADSQLSLNDHPHHWHAYTGVLMMVIPDGHIAQKCCMCPAIRTIHRDHTEERNGRCSGHS